MKKTWKPTTAGILSIIAGTIGVIGGIWIVVIGAGIAGLGACPWMEAVPEMPDILPNILGVLGIMVGAIAIPAIIMGAVAIVGGIYALRRQKWGLALAGSVCALIGSGPLLGILAIIFVAMGKGEFE